MTPLPEASPSAGITLHDPLFAARFSTAAAAAAVDAVTIAPRFVRFLPSRTLRFFLFFSPALLYSPAGEIEFGLFSFRVYLVFLRPSQLSFFSLILRRSCRRDSPSLPRATLSSRLFIHSCALGPREGAALKLH